MLLVDLGLLLGLFFRLRVRAFGGSGVAYRSGAVDGGQARVLIPLLAAIDVRLLRQLLLLFGQRFPSELLALAISLLRAGAVLAFAGGDRAARTRGGRRVLRLRGRDLRRRGLGRAHDGARRRRILFQRGGCGRRGRRLRLGSRRSRLIVGGRRLERRRRRRLHLFLRQRRQVLLRLPRQIRRHARRVIGQNFRRDHHDELGLV